MGEGRDVVMSELGYSMCGDAVAGGRRLRIATRILRVLKGLPGQLVSRQVILFSVLFGNAMGVPRRIMQFDGPPTIIVMRFRVVSSWHSHTKSLHETDHSHGQRVGSTLASRTFMKKPQDEGRQTYSTSPSTKKHGQGPGSAGQSGDTQGLPDEAEAGSESVLELAEEGQSFEAEVIDGVEDAPDADVAEVHTRQVPEDDVPSEYLGKDD